MRSLLLALVPSIALAEPVGEDDAPSSRPAEHTAADVEHAPLPGQESGRVDAETGDSTARTIGRGVLYLPRLAVEGVFAPVRAGLWAYERYHLKARTLGLLFSEDGTYGIYPVAHLESQYGINVGARFVHRDLLGRREHLALHAGTGGRFRQISSVELRSGERLGERFALQLDSQFERRPRDAFYGLGNADGMAEARFREELLRGALVGDVRVAGALHLRASGAIADFEFDRSSDGPPIDELYPAETMVGYGGFAHGYGELELRWDTRRTASPWDPDSVRSTGWLLAGYAGRVHRLDAGEDYYRYGLDLQRFIPLGRGPRVLSARIYGEAVTGELDEVPFTQLPRLGGKTLLRGYPFDRFRDRVAALGSIEYAWDLGRYISASTFVDIGRVYPSLRDLTTDGVRTGYGIALQAHSEKSFLFRASLASSFDGGVFLDISFDPVFDLDNRVERR